MNFKRLTFMFLVWLCVYPIVTGILYTIQYFELTLPIAVKTFISTSILVPLIDVGIIPFLKAKMK